MLYQIRLRDYEGNNRVCLVELEGNHTELIKVIKDYEKKHEGFIFDDVKYIKIKGDET